MNLNLFKVAYSVEIRAENRKFIEINDFAIIRLR